MAFKLKTKSQAAAEKEETAEETKPAAKKGWGKVAAKQDDEADETEQRAEIQSKLAGKPREVEEPEADDDSEKTPVDAKSAFSAATQAAMKGEEADEAEDDPAPKQKPKRAKKTAPQDNAPTPCYRHLNVEVSVAISDDGSPVPSVRAYASINEDFEEDGAVRIAELAAVAAEAAFNKLVGEEE